MKDEILRFLDTVIYWSIVLMPFSVAIAPGVVNTFIGLFSLSFILKKLIKKEIPFINRAVLLPYIFLLAVSLISFKNTVSFGTSLQGVAKLLKYLMIFIVCSEQIKDKKHIMRIIFSVGCGLSLVAIDSIWQLKFGRDFIRGNVLQQAIGLIRPTAAFPNPNVMGVYLSALTPLILGLTILYFKGKKKILMFIIGFLAVMGAYLTLSRGTGLGLYLSVLFLSIIRKKKTLFFTLIAAILIFPFVMPRNISDWAKEVKYNPLVFMCNYERISIYKNAINMIKQHPFIGVGVNTFTKNYLKYKLPEPEYAKTSDAIYAHNNFLHMAGEIGLLGLAAFFWFLFNLFRINIVVYNKLKDEYLKVICLSLMASLISFLINGLTETSLYYSRVAMVFWFLIGFSLALEKFIYADKSG